MAGPPQPSSDNSGGVLAGPPAWVHALTLCLFKSVVALCATFVAVASIAAGVVVHSGWPGPARVVAEAVPTPGEVATQDARSADVMDGLAKIVKEMMERIAKANAMEGVHQSSGEGVSPTTSGFQPLIAKVNAQRPKRSKRSKAKRAKVKSEPMRSHKHTRSSENSTIVKPRKSMPVNLNGL